MKSAVICSAGMGKRLGLGIPKALVEICGKRLIDWQLEALEGYDVTVVVGFQADKVIEAIAGRAKTVINTDYETTSTVHSIAISGAPSDAVAIDGDLLFTKEDIQRLPDGPFVGVCEPRSDGPVLAKVVDGKVVAFEDGEHEWACICRGDLGWFEGHRTGFVYKVLENHLPLPAANFRSNEIDTPQDLERARRWWWDRMIKQFWHGREKGKFLWKLETTDIDVANIRSRVRPGDKILDLGAGDGRLVHSLTDCEVTAVDYCEVVLDCKAPNIHPIVCDVREFQTDEYFDMAILFGLINFFTDKEVETIYRNCRKMAKKMLVKHQCGNEGDVVVFSKIDGKPYTASYPHWEKELKRIEAAGFHVEVTKPYPPKFNPHPNTSFFMFEAT